MAAGTLASFAVQSIFMLWMVDRKVGGLDLRRSSKQIGKMIVATAVMTLVCLAVRRLPIYPTAATRGIWLSQLIILIGVGALTYFAACAALGVNILSQLRPARKR